MRRGGMERVVEWVRVWVAVCMCVLCVVCMMLQGGAPGREREDAFADVSVCVHEI